MLSLCWAHTQFVGFVMSRLIYRSGQTVYTQISLIRIYTVCHSICIILLGNYSMVQPPCSKFRVITANVSGVRIFRIFTVPSYAIFQICHLHSPVPAHQFSCVSFTASSIQMVQRCKEAKTRLTFASHAVILRPKKKKQYVWFGVSQPYLIILVKPNFYTPGIQSI